MQQGVPAAEAVRRLVGADDLASRVTHHHGLRRLVQNGARQPFGGNRLSGTGTKAGGPGYLLQFVEPRVVTENTMRHGLVV